MRSPLLLLVLLSFAVPVAADPLDESPILEKKVEPPVEESAGLTYGFETDLVSRYVFRGVQFNEGAVLQSSAWVSTRSLSFTLWTNYPFERGDSKGKVDEFDYTLTYSREWKPFSFESTINYYHYPDFADTAEVSLKFSRPVGTVTLFTSQTFDVLEYDGAYFGELGVTKETEMSPRLTMESGFSVGWGNAKHSEAYVGVHRGAFTVAGAQLAWTYSGKKGFYVRPHVGVTALLDKRLRDAVEKPTIFTAGIALGKEF